jgi:hypothetical protein
MKRLVAGLVALIAGRGLFAPWAGAQEADLRESPPAAWESVWPEQGLVTELRAIHDLRGGVYVPSIAAGAFRLLRAGAEGALGPYEPEGFEGASLAARSLKAIGDGPERYLAFIGRGRDGGDSIQLFGFGFWDDLSYCPLAETEAAAITDYSLVASRNGGVSVYVLAGGRLRRFSTGIREGAPRRLEEISRPDETVEAFEVRRERSQEISYGWYRVAREDSWETTLFSLDDEGNLAVERTGPWPRIPRLAYGVSPEGKTVLTLVAGSAVLVCHAEGLRLMRDALFDAPLAVKRYSPALLTGESLGLLIGEAEGTEVLYGVSHEQSGAPAFRELFAAPSTEILDLFPAGDNRISLLCRSNQTLTAVLLNPEGGIIAEGPLPASAAGSLLFRHPLGENRVCLLSGAGEERILTTLAFENEAWRVIGEARVPAFVPEELLFPAGVRGPLLMVSPEALMLCDPESARGRVIPARRHALSAALNGVAYLAVASGDGIALCRIEG